MCPTFVPLQHFLHSDWPRFLAAESKTKSFPMIVSTKTEPSFLGRANLHLVERELCWPLLQSFCIITTPRASASDPEASLCSQHTNTPLDKVMIVFFILTNFCFPSATPCPWIHSCWSVAVAASQGFDLNTMMLKQLCEQLVFKLWGLVSG